MSAILFLAANVLILVFPGMWYSNFAAAILYLAAALVTDTLVIATIGAVGTCLFVAFAGMYRVRDLTGKCEL